MSTRALARSASAPSLFDDFFKPWNEWFDDRSFFNRVTNIPSVNITENNNHYNVALAAPGLKKDDFRIDVEGNILTISSEREETKEEKEEKYTRKEYGYSSFSRSFTLPDDVKEEAIEATYENGVLNLRLPRKENGKKTSASKRIAVK
jgi:HSP20 family protein